MININILKMKLDKTILPIAFVKQEARFNIAYKVCTIYKMHHTDTGR